MFLNKFDLFTEKINKTNHHLRLYYPRYDGPDHDVSAAKEFIRDKFLDCGFKRGDTIFVHFTTATDTDNIKVVFKMVSKTVSSQNLGGANLA